MRKFGSLLLLLAVLATAGCSRKSGRVLEAAYVSVPQVTLRDRVAAVYNKVGVVKNGERVEVLERSKNGRFARVRAADGAQGWMELRYLVSQQVYDGFRSLASSHAATPVAAHAVTRAELNMHLTPERQGEKLYQLEASAKVVLLERAVTARPSPPQAQALAVASKPGTSASTAPPAPVLEDWWLARDAQGRAGWVLGRMLDVDVPLEVAQYAEGQRIVAAFVLDQVEDQGRQVPQYLMLLTEPKDGQPFDYNQARVFTWNPKRDHYETAWRERRLVGALPVRVAPENFAKEGTLPTFTLRLRDDEGKLEERKYKLNGVMVRRVTAEGEETKEKVKRKK